MSNFAGRERSGRLVQLVTHAANGKYLTRILRIGLQLLSETINMRIDISLIAFVVGAPDTIQKCISRPGSARFRSQQLKNLKLELSEIDPRAISQYFMASLVDN